MRRTLMGIDLVEPRLTPGVQKPRSWTRKYSARYVWRVRSRYVFVTWSKYVGFTPVEVFDVVGGVVANRTPFVYPRRRKVKKPSAAAPADPDPDRAPQASVVLKKFPRLVAFLGDRFYDNGEPRMPGSAWFDCDAMAFRCMLKEPSLFLQTRIRAATLDDLFAAVEAFLGMESAPWEPDVFAREKVAPKKKK